MVKIQFKASAKKGREAFEVDVDEVEFKNVLQSFAPTTVELARSALTWAPFGAPSVPENGKVAQARLEFIQVRLPNILDFERWITGMLAEIAGLPADHPRVEATCVAIMAMMRSGTELDSVPTLQKSKFSNLRQELELIRYLWPVESTDTEEIDVL
jgi:hypothetical protein